MLVSDGFQFELVFSHRSVEIFVFDQDGQPVRLNDVRGRVAFVFGGDRRTFRYDLYPPPRGAPAQNRLYLAVDLSRVPDRGVSVNVALQGLGQRPIKFTIPFQRTRTVEQIAIERQRICPVSGKLLGSMGQPVKVTIDKRDVFVCCAGCESPLRKNPLVHLAKLAPTAPAKATKADAATIARQRLCPVSGEPLNSMGGAWKVIVRGEPVFVCCKGCVRTVQENPVQYLSKVATARSQTTRR
jgi:YHS domain-containing protein